MASAPGRASLGATSLAEPAIARPGSAPMRIPWTSPATRDATGTAGCISFYVSVLCVSCFLSAAVAFVAIVVVGVVAGVVNRYHVAIGSGVYTGRQTTRIRETYGIQGTHEDDVITGIFCQPCSLIRNELEIRRRENARRQLELSSGLRPPVPLGDDAFQPIYTMAVTQPYTSEPRMNSSGPAKGRLKGREVHFHEPLQGESGSSAQNPPRMVPLYPTDRNMQKQGA